MILGGALALLLASVLVAWMWHRKKGRGSAEIAQFGLLLGRLEATHPQFCRIMTPFLSNKRFGELLQGREARTALALFRQGGLFEDTEAIPVRKVSRTLLEITSNPRQVSESRFNAATVTLLRLVYEDERLRNKLSAEAREDLDSLLDSLTETRTID